MTSLTKETGFQILQEMINNKTPFFIGRLSGNESRLCGLALTRQPIDMNIVHAMSNNAGIKLNTQADLDEYISAYMKAVDSCGLLGVWDGGMYQQAADFYRCIHEKYKSKYIPAQSLEPYYFFDTPTYEPLFKSKRILIISSHEQTIRKQLSKIDSIFPKKIFDQCEFILVRPPQQHAGGSDGMSWTHHMELFKQAIRSVSFDVALVSCGGFGMPICDFIYSEMGLSVIYVGGSLQLFFGIMGRRWNGNDAVRTYQNSSWRSPLEEDRPPGYMNIEGGCYW